MKFDGGAWQHAAVVIQSEGYQAWLAWMVTVMPREWLNGLASAITHQRTTDRADMKQPGQVEYRDGTVEDID